MAALPVPVEFEMRHMQEDEIAEAFELIRIEQKSESFLEKLSSKLAKTKLGQRFGVLHFH